MSTITLDQQIACVQREIRMRERVYPAWVSRNRMNERTAENEILAMRAVLATLERIKAERMRSDPLCQALNMGDGVYRP